MSVQMPGKEGQIGHSTTLRPAHGANSRLRLASLLQESRKGGNICPSSGAIWECRFRVKSAIHETILIDGSIERHAASI